LRRSGQRSRDRDDWGITCDGISGHIDRRFQLRRDDARRL